MIPQEQGTGEIPPGRDEDGAAPVLRASIDGLLQSRCIQRQAIPPGPELEGIEEIQAAWHGSRRHGIFSPPAFSISRVARMNGPTPLKSFGMIGSLI